MTKEEFCARTKALALQVMQVVERLPRSQSGAVIGRQLLRSGTSVGANYRSACRARSRREFIAKMGIVEEEADETMFWLELIAASNWKTPVDVMQIKREVEQILALSVASIRTARLARRAPQRANPHPAIRNPQCS